MPSVEAVYTNCTILGSDRRIKPMISCTPGENFIFIPFVYDSEAITKQ
jgi:hypothetical protein